MQDITRRNWVVGSLSGAALLASGAFAQALRTGERYDLVIKGGEVLDPSRKLRGVRDIGIRSAVIVAVEADIPEKLAVQTIDARGKLVTPGLIDLHAHVYPLGSDRKSTRLNSSHLGISYAV